MAYKQKEGIIYGFVMLFIVFSSIFFCYLLYNYPPIWRRTIGRHREIEPLELHTDDRDYTDLGRIHIDIQENGDSNGNGVTDGSKRVLLLLGDSILANEKYVQKGKSVVDFLKKDVGSDIEIALFARDNYTIDDVYFQIPTLPISYNSNNTKIILSVGGNNFLSGTSFQEARKEYTYLISRIKDSFGESKIYLVNLYLPFDPVLQKLYDKIVVDWNSFLEGIVEKGGADGIVDISSIITEPKDLVYKIEPSVIGGEKIAQTIMDDVVNV
jgi:hypothetical protein